MTDYTDPLIDLDEYIEQQKLKWVLEDLEEVIVKDKGTARMEMSSTQGPGQAGNSQISVSIVVVFSMFWHPYYLAIEMKLNIYVVTVMSMLPAMMLRQPDLSFFPSFFSISRVPYLYFF